MPSRVWREEPAGDRPAKEGALRVLRGIGCAEGNARAVAGRKKMEKTGGVLSGRACGGGDGGGAARAWASATTDDDGRREERKKAEKGGGKRREKERRDAKSRETRKQTD